MNTELDTIAKRIRHRLVVLGMKQTQLADELEMSREMISQWALGRTIPHTRNLELLCVKLQCSIDWLLTGSETSA